MGRPVVHWELWSQQPQKLSDFYATVFGWQIQPVPGMSYRFIDTGQPGAATGGIATPTEEPWPGNLALFIDVEDLDAFCTRIVQAGGTILVQRREVPGFGAYALFADPDGRAMGLWQRQP